MAAYENVEPVPGKTAEVKILADMQKINRALRDPDRWAPTMREVNDRNFVRSRFEREMSNIADGRSIRTPWLRLTPVGDLDVEESLDQLYACRESGFDQVHVTCEPDVEGAIRAIVV